MLLCLRSLQLIVFNCGDSLMERAIGLPLVPGWCQSMVVCLWLMVLNCSVFAAHYARSLGPQFLLEQSDWLGPGLCGANMASPCSHFLSEIKNWQGRN